MNFSRRIPFRTSRFPTACCWIAVWAGVVGPCTVSQSATADELTSGARVEFVVSSADGSPPRRDIAVLPNLQWYLPAGAAPTAFLDPGRVTTIWTGFVSAPLRSFFSFDVSFNGQLELEINGKTLIRTNSNGANPIASSLIRLNKGTNAFRLEYTLAPGQDAWLRLNWAERGKLDGPIPRAAIHHASDASLAQMEQLRLGRELFAEFRCIRCHQPPPDFHSGMPELSVDAPDFNGIGSRQNAAWMAQWIFDPMAHRKTAEMPRMFYGPDARAKADAAAVFLAGLTGEDSDAILNNPPGGSGASDSRRAPAVRVSRPADNQSQPSARAEMIRAGKHLFDALHCLACHESLEGAADEGKISLRIVGKKFPERALAAFLKNPEAHYAWIRMPNFRLSDGEAGQLAAYLTSAAEKESGALLEQSLRERGREIVQSAGCLSCHRLDLANKASGKSLETIRSSGQKGCLAAGPDPENRAPFFGFGQVEIAALTVFLPKVWQSLWRNDPLEFAQRQTPRLQCRECHGKFEGFPALDLLGGKLKPEWSSRFIAGSILTKPRPWLEARMPAFPKWADELARGLALEEGVRQVTLPEGPIDLELAKIGQKLISANGGFSCIACHAIRNRRSAQVVENFGIDFALSGERLLKAYFHRWVLNPLRLDPTTKMPEFFDEQGRSTLTDILEGDGQKQIEAIWQYLRLGDNMPLPPQTGQ